MRPRGGGASSVRAVLARPSQTSKCAPHSSTDHIDETSQEPRRRVCVLLGYICIYAIYSLGVTFMNTSEHY